MAYSGLRATLVVTLLIAFVGRALAAPAGGDVAFMKAASAAVDTIAREDGFSGVILVARGDQVLLRKAAGFADYQRNIRNTPETPFPLLSVTKQFTAAAIMLLVQDGKVSLDDPISKFYPSSPPTWKDVTIRHLLTHGSGIQDYWINRPESRVRFYPSYEDYFRIVEGDPLGFAPGTSISYSNAGYALLTAVIERASGQPYAEFVQTRILAPLGMRSTGYGPIPGDAMRGYQGPWHNWLNWVTPDYTPTGGAGAMYSTLDDMLIWSRVLTGDRILSDESRSAMFADYGHNYGFGWRVQDKFGRRLIWHTGSGGPTGGFGSIYDRFPEEELTVIAMTNNSGLIDFQATLVVDGKPLTFPANAARKLVEEVERLYFGRAP